jgi:ribosomal protein S7
MRKAKPKKRYLLPDPKFNDPMITKFVNYLMEDGKKSVAYNVFYDTILNLPSINDGGLYHVFQPMRAAENVWYWPTLSFAQYVHGHDVTIS